MFYSGGASDQGGAGAGGSAAQTVTKTVTQTTSTGDSITEAVSSPATQIGYAYSDNSGQVQYSPNPVTYVGQGASGVTGAPNPGLIVDSQGTVLSGPGTGGTYNATTNTTAGAPNATTSGVSLFPILLIGGLAAAYLIYRGGA